VPSATLIAITDWSPTEWHERFRALAPKRDIRVWPDGVGDAADIVYACAWRPPPGLLRGFPNLKVIFSLGAGVDHIVTDPELPAVPVVRIVDHDLTMRMTEYVVLHALMHHRRLRLYDHQQRQRLWLDHPQPAASEVNVGVMGLGAIGSDAALALKRIGFNVAGWSRTAKAIAGIATYAGADGLDAFLARTEILVCVLPHTPATDGLLNCQLFRKLKRDGAAGGAFLINAGRGRLQVDADIIAALDEGVLAGVSLDVFPTEPLSATSPLWAHPKITITPHNAGFSDPRSLAINVLQQIERFERGESLQNVIDRSAGY
jgi:glyoxylate/hydroxypyruvate reductase A